MTDITTASPAAAAARHTGSLLERGDRTRHRHASERRFRILGLIAVTFGILALVGVRKVKKVRGPERAIHQAQEAKAVLKRG